MRPGGIAELPEIVPVFPLAGVVLLPFGELPLNVFEPRYLAMCDDALGGTRLIGMIQPEDPEDKTDAPTLCRVGCAGRITRFRETADNRYLITLSGLCRFAAGDELPQKDGYRRMRVDWTPYGDDFRTPEDDAVPRDRLLEALRDYCRAHNLAADWKSAESAPGAQLVAALAIMCPFGPREKQALLEAEDAARRADLLVSLLAMAVHERRDAGPALN